LRPWLLANVRSTKIVIERPPKQFDAGGRGHASMHGENSRADEAALSVNPRRWWLLRAVCRHPLTRLVDRVEAGVVTVAAALVMLSTCWVVGLHDTVYAQRSRTIAAEAATRHPVQATAIELSRSGARQPGTGTPTYFVRVEWFADAATREDVIETNRAAEAGDRMRIWLDREGRVTDPPSTNTDARADALGVAALLWLVSAAMIVGAVAILRQVLDRCRYRGWDRTLRLLIDDGGGSSTRRA
jgi:hypothetical protein